VENGNAKRQIMRKIKLLDLGTTGQQTIMKEYFKNYSGFTQT
jgi:hypothetical protein